MGPQLGGGEAPQCAALEEHGGTVAAARDTHSWTDDTRSEVACGHTVAAEDSDDSKVGGLHSIVAVDGTCCCPRCRWDVRIVPYAYYCFQLLGYFWEALDIAQLVESSRGLEDGCMDRSAVLRDGVVREG